jgi:hypothetical protein
MRNNFTGMFTLSFVLTTSVASFAAVPSTQWVEVHTGKMDDPSLTGFTTWAMRVTADTDWTNSDLVVNLTNGSMNHYLAPGPDAGPAFPVLGDTAVFGPLTSLGDLTGGWGDFSLVQPHTETPTTFVTSWFNVNSGDTGTFDAAMLTISNNAHGTIEWRSISGGDAEYRGYNGRGVGLTICHGVVGVLDPPPSCIPEPTTATLALAALCLVSGRRRQNGWTSPGV